jgi:PAS domain S-box-containing protein
MAFCVIYDGFINKQILNDIIVIREDGMKDEEKKKGQFVTKTGSINNKKDAYERLPEADAMFQSLFNFSPDAIIVVNNKGHILQANAQAEKIFGYTGKELIGKPVDILIPGRFRERHNEKMNEYLKNPRIRLMGADLELYALRKDGTEFPVDIALGYIETKDGIIVLSVVRDITEHEMMDTEIRLLLALTQAINESKDLNTAIQIALKKVCEATGWNYGEAWVLGKDKKSHVCCPVWYSNDARLEKFRRISEKCVFPTGTGLPGRIWLSKKPEWIPDVSILSQPIYPRVTVAKECGVRAGLGVPIIADNEVLAVLVFLMFDYQKKDKLLVDIVSAVATQLGSVIKRKVAEERFREASLYARNLIEASLDPFATISPDGIITDVNKATEEVTGVPREKLIGSDFSDYFTEPDKAREGYRQVFEKGIVRDYLLAIRHISGDITDVLYNATVYRNDAGEVEGVFAAARDITEHKKMEEAIRISEAKYRSIFENAAEGIFQTTIDGRILAANPACVRILGYDSAQELIAGVTDVRKLYAEPGRRLHLVRLIRADGAVSDFEAMVNRKDGTKIWISINAHALQDPGGKVVGLEGMVIDITNRKRAEKNFQTLIDGAPDAIIAIENNFNILLINTHTEKLFGYTSLELLGSSYEILIPERFRKEHAEYCKTYFANPSTKIMALHMNSVAKRRDGTEFPVEINMSPVETDEGIIIVIDIRDITEKKK